MSIIYNSDATNDWISATVWIRENRPENGWFRAYWEKDGNGVSLEDTGFGLRFEWEYKDGERADGISKGWYPNGVLKHTWNWKDKKQVGKYNLWYPNGQKKIESYFDNGVPKGLATWWYDNGNKMKEYTFVNGKMPDKIREWNRDGSPKKEEKKD